VSEEYRVPIESFVIGCPAGLVGDTHGQEAETIEVAVKRELLEEAGYSAKKVTILTQGPTSPGQTDEVIAIVLAEGLQKTAAGGGLEGESIVIHEVPLNAIDTWLSGKQRQNMLIDPKLYTVLYFVRRDAMQLDSPP
jgi:ADP-ribose pyrophosphatase